MYMWNLKEYNKPVNKTKKKQTHRYREETSSYQWGEGKEEKVSKRSIMYTALETSDQKVLKVIYCIPRPGYHSVLDQKKKKELFFFNNRGK